MIKISESLYGFNSNVYVAKADIDDLKQRILRSYSIITGQQLARREVAGDAAAAPEATFQPVIKGSGR